MTAERGREGSRQQRLRFIFKPRHSTMYQSDHYIIRPYYNITHRPRHPARPSRSPLTMSTSNPSTTLTNGSTGTSTPTVTSSQSDSNTATLYLCVLLPHTPRWDVAHIVHLRPLPSSWTRLASRSSPQFWSSCCFRHHSFLDPIFSAGDTGGASSKLSLIAFLSSSTAAHSMIDSITWADSIVLLDD